MEYKTITRPDGSEQQLAVYDGKCRFWMEGLYDGLPDTAEKRAEECSLPVKIDRREDGTVSVGTQSLVPWETDYGKLEIMADVYLNYLAQDPLGVRLGQRRPRQPDDRRGEGNHQRKQINLPSR